MTELAATERALLTALGTIRDHWDALLIPTSGGGQGIGKASDPVTATDRRVSLRHEVTLCLNGWARIIVEDRDLTHRLPLGTDTLGLIELLERWARWFSGHEAAQDAADELTTWANEVRATAAPTRREWVALGPCPLEVEAGGDRTVCAGSVRAYPNADPTCQRCGTTAVASWWERVMFPDSEASDLVTAAELVLVLHKAFGGTPVKPSAIRQWIKRGVIESSGTDDKGRTLFSREAVIWAVSRRHAAIT